MNDADNLVAGSYFPFSASPALFNTGNAWKSLAAVAFYWTYPVWKKLLMLGVFDGEEDAEKGDNTDTVNIYLVSSTSLRDRQRKSAKLIDMSNSKICQREQSKSEIQQKSWDAFYTETPNNLQ